jgi:hypothetical protein
MQSRVTSFSLALVFALSQASCKPQRVQSNVQFDKEVSKILDFNTLAPARQREICTRSPLIVFVGNAERVFTGTLGNSPRLPRDSASTPDLYKVVQDASSALFRNMANNGDCTSLYKQGLPIPHALLVSILDGPYSVDSTIQSAWFTAGPKGTWGPLFEADGRTWIRPWTIRPDGAIQPHTTGTAWEMHLPTQLSSVVNFFLRMKPPARPEALVKEAARNGVALGPDREKFAFDQTIYMVKSHGGRFVTTMTPPSLRDSTLPLAEQVRRESSAGHVFLFDSFGPRGDVRTSALFSSYWLPSQGCQLIARDRSTPRENILQNPGLCLKCTQQLQADKADLGNFTGCVEQLKDYTWAALPPEQLEVLGLNPSLVKNRNPSPKPTEQGNPSDSATLGLMGSTLGLMGSTLGLMGSTLGLMGSTLGSGKGFLYRTGTTPAGYKPTLDLPNGVLHAAAAASYETLGAAIEGVTPLSLPGGQFVPKVDAQGKAVNSGPGPTLLMLDSCYGQSSVGWAVKNLIPDRSLDVVVMNNPNPMQTAIVNYGALNYTQYVMLPHVFSWSAAASVLGRLEQDNSYMAMKRSLEQHMNTTGMSIAGEGNTQQKASQGSSTAAPAEQSRLQRMFNFTVITAPRPDAPARIVKADEDGSPAEGNPAPTQ